MSSGSRSILVARDRLRKVLVQDRSPISQECLDALTESVFLTAREQVVLAEGDLAAAVEYSDGAVILTIRLPILGVVNLRERAISGERGDSMNG